MVKTTQQNSRRNLTDVSVSKAHLSVGSRKREVSRMVKHNDMKKTVAGRHNCVVNGPDWGDSDLVESDNSMEISLGIEKRSVKRGGNFVATGAKTIRSIGDCAGGSRQFGV